MSIDATFNRLPPELLSLILTKLELKDKLNCKLVSRSFKFTIDHLVQHDRLIYVSTKFCTSWFKDEDLSGREDLVICRPDTLFDQLNNQRLFYNLRRLVLNFNYYEEESDLVGCLNRMQSLEELNLYHIKQDPTNVQLNLPKLKLLSLEHIYPRLILNTPMLSIFRGDIRLYEFVYPNKLKYLYLDYASANEVTFAQFTNLEYLMCRHWSDLNANIVRKLSSLKQLHRCVCSKPGEDAITTEDLDAFQNLTDAKRSSNLTSLELLISVFENGVFYDVVNCMDDYCFFIETHLKFIKTLPFDQHTRTGSFEFENDELVFKVS